MTADAQQLLGLLVTPCAYAQRCVCPDDGERCDCGAEYGSDTDAEDDGYDDD